MNPFEWKLCILIHISLNFVPKGLVSRSTIVPTMQQAITFTNVDLDLWHNMASPAYNKLKHFSMPNNT